MPKFRIRAQWYGNDGHQLGVAEDDIEAENACEVIDSALPGEWYSDEFTGATITIEKVG